MAFGFKVVSVTESGNLQSAFGCPYCDGSKRLRQTYTIGEWAVRKKGWGPLACFDADMHAWAFVRNERDTFDLKVFPCEYILSDDSELWGREFGMLIKSIKIMNPSWKRLGTVYADAVRIF